MTELLSPPASRDHRRAFAGNGAFVDRGEPLDDLAVGRDDIARLTFEDIVFFQRVAADDTNGIAVDQFGRGLLARFAQRIGLRFAARFGDRLCEIGEQQRNEQHDEDDEVVSERPLGRIPRNEDVEQQDEHDGRDDLDGEHDRVFNHRPRSSLRTDAPRLSLMSCLSNSELDLFMVFNRLFA